MRIRLFFVAMLIAISFTAHIVSAYPVQKSLGLAELEKQADLICKVEAEASKPAEESPYRSVPGFEVLSTSFKTVEVYKGGNVGAEITFIHYAPKKNEMTFLFMPQHYEFERGKFYILFAKKTNHDGVFQQLWENHRNKEDQGLVRAADGTKYGKQLIRDVLWSESTKLLASKNAEEVLYAIKQLDDMSRGSYDQLKDFDRSKTLIAIEPLIRNSNSEIAKAAISALASRNPYVYSGHVDSGYAHWYWDKFGSAPARPFWRPLAELANSDRSPELRALAILALGRVLEPQLGVHMKRWLVDPAPAIRQSATIILPDFPDLANDETIERLAKDKEAVVRAGLAQAIGYGQWSNRANWLAVLIKDADPNVAQAAAMSLLSLPTKETRKTLEALIDQTEYRPLIVNALAAENPRPYLDALADIIRHDRRPEHWWGGSIPWGVSWDILFKLVQSHPAEMKEGKLDSTLDALESPTYFSSSEPRDLYALYLQQHMTKRAAAFREVCKKRVNYDMDYYFKMVDEHPNQYRRE
jgi:HEAT repeat protein